MALMAASAQSATWVHVNSNISIFSADTVSVFGDMVHEGNLLSYSGSVVNFFGSRWRNTSNAVILDESSDGYSAAGGLFRFIKTDTAAFQYINGGFSEVLDEGPSFPNISVENPEGIFLDDLSDLKIVNVLNLQKGHVFLNGWNLVMGHHTPGDIQHYSSKNFIVTGSGFSSGCLIRNNIPPNSNSVTFPIGTKPSSFTPAVAEHLSAMANIRVGVTDSVYQNLTTGNNMILISVNKTWQVSMSQPDVSATIRLVHNVSDQGPLYQANRNTAYISRYTNNWDLAATHAAPTSPSNYTTGHPDPQSAVVSRTFQQLSTNNYFTSLVAKTVDSTEKTTLLFFKAFRSNINKDSIILQWVTGTEYFCKGFTLERKLAGDNAFDSICFFLSKSPGGISFFPVSYGTVDIPASDNFIFYRLKVTMTDGSFFYSTVQVVKGKNIKNDMIIWPNPLSNGVIHIYYGLTQYIKAVALVDVFGHRLLYQKFQQPLQLRNYFEIKYPFNLASGIYFLHFIGLNDELLHAEKVVLLE